MIRLLIVISRGQILQFRMQALTLATVVAFAIDRCLTDINARPYRIPGFGLNHHVTGGSVDMLLRSLDDYLCMQCNTVHWQNWKASVISCSTSGIILASTLRQPHNPLQFSPD
jgi:hypothetical protein